MGPHIDIIDKLSASVRNDGLRFGLYYSLLEWDNPLYSKETINDWVDKHMIPQMQELVNAYKPEIIFSDGEWDYDSKTLKSEKFLAWLYNESPVKNTVIVNDRWGKETRSKHGDYYTTEYDLVHSSEGIGEKASHLWEESRGIGTSYGYNKFETPDHYLSAKELIYILVDKVSNGGNFLLNVGPDADGLIPPIMQDRLLEIGKWLDINGEAIYKTKVWNRANEYKKKNVHFTQKGNDLYVIFTEWTGEPLVISNSKSPAKIELLGYNGEVKANFDNSRLEFSLPKISIKDIPCNHAWTIKISGIDE
jgi:alpha-L-fucosidase